MRGEGRSYGDSSLNEIGAVISQRGVARVLGFDPETGVLECEAGLTIAQIIKAFLPRGFFPSVTPGTKFVTVGGAIAADVHGKNHHAHGTFSCFVESLELLIADGTVLSCSRDQNPAIFWGTIGGMGLTGVILTARMRLTPVTSSFMDVSVARAANIDQVIESFDAEGSDTPYSVAWLDCLASGRRLGRSVLFRGSHAEKSALPPGSRRSPLTVVKDGRRSVPCALPGGVLNRWTVAAFNSLYYGMHRGKRSLQNYDDFFYPLDGVRRWNRIYGKRGFVQYQALLPSESSREGTIELLEAISSARVGSFLSVFKKTGPQGPGLLSFPREGHTLALDLPNRGDRLKSLMRRLDHIVMKHGGRLYLAKDALMERSTFDAMYPNAQAFRTLKRTIDPDDRFMSRQARRLGLSAANG